MPRHDFPRALVQSVLQGRLVPFVGAGVSRSVLTQDGEIAFPTWYELLQYGASELEHQQKKDEAEWVRASLKVKKEDLARIAEFLRENLVGNTWTRFLEKYLAVPRRSVQEASLALPRAIWGLPSKLLITTNFDKVLTWAYPDPLEDIRILDVDNYSGFADVASGDLVKPTVWHLHGHIDDPGKIILTSDAYNHLYPSQDVLSPAYNAALTVLQGVLASKTLLFIGFSFADEYLCRQLEWLMKTFRGLGQSHFALVHQNELEKAAALLDPLQVTRISFEDFGEPLVEVVRAIGSLREEAMLVGAHIDLTKLGEASEPTPIGERWRATRAVRLMDLLGPTYILDRSYFFLDWNPAFERLFAQPLGLFRGQHAQEFVRSLVNRELVETRSREAFGGSEPPLVDMEPLFFKSPEFGLVKLWKIASRIIDENGHLSAWSVALNILGADNMEALWQELQRVLEERVNWSLYAPSYDNLLLNFDEYGKLVELVCSKLDGLRICADLGAGTGNGTLELLRRRPDRMVWAIEPNEEMLLRLRNKVGEKGAGLADRVRFIKQGIARLGGFEPEFFDGAIMINVLYAVDEPKECLKEVARVLQPGGVLVLSTPHRGTDVDRLFDAMRKNLAEKGLLSELRANLDDARNRHDNMMTKIHRDTKDDVRGYLQNAGFSIDDWLDDQYAGSVVVVKAVRK